VLVGAAGAVRVDAPRRPVPKAARGGLGWGLTALLVVLVAGSLAVAFGWVDLRAITSRMRGGPGAGPVEVGAADAGAPAAAAKVMDFRVIASAPGASVRVDGAERGRAPAVVLLPQDGRPHEVEVSAEGFGTWRGAWRQGDPPVVAANLEPTADVDSLVRLLVLDVGALPRGAMLRLASKLACEPPPGIGGLQPGITCVTVPFTRSGNGAPWQPADALVLQAVRADGTPAEIEFGAMRAMGEVRPALTPQDASARVRVRVH
jgi:hypothetical protein